MEKKLLRHDLVPRRSPWYLVGERCGSPLLGALLLGGFIVGLLITIFRESLLPDQYHRDAQRISNIAAGLVPDFSDRSYTPVGIAYRWLGLGTSPDAAAIVGYLLASIAIAVAVFVSRRRTVSLLTGGYIFAAFVLSGIYLGQYSKDVFVLVPVVILLLLPRSIWWDFVAVVVMAAYAYLFRDYWYLVAVFYAAYRVITLWQVRLRYLLISGALAAVGVGLAFFVVRGVDPNHYRTVVQGHLEANTLIVPLEPFAQPTGGAIDVFFNYWLLYVPALLPFTASFAYIVVALGIAFVKLVPLISVSSSVRWPSSSTREGTLVRRALSLILAFGVVQAVFEPDYGSALRHLTPLMALAVALMLTSRSGTQRFGPSQPWSWTGAGMESAITRSHPAGTTLTNRSMSQDRPLETKDD